jgi:uncharacterized protein (TIGR03437 family)
MITEYPVPTAASNPTFITTGPDGNLWFTESDANKIGKITASGTITEFAVPTPNSQPWAITAGPDGNLWFTEISGNKIGIITTSGLFTEYPLPGVPVPGQYPMPNSIIAGPDGNLWFTEPDSDSGKIGRITTSGVISEYRVPQITDTVAHPTGIASGPDGNLWFTGHFGVGRISTDGVITSYPLVVGIHTDYLGLRDMAKGSDGNLWVTGSSIVWRISTDGGVASYSVPDLGNFVFDYTDRGIAAGADGNLWFAATPSNKIGRITPGGVVTEYSIPTGDSKVAQIAPGPDGNIWFTEQASNKIGKLDLATVPAENLLSISPPSLTFTSLAPPNVSSPAQGLTVTTSPTTAYTVSSGMFLAPNLPTISPSGNLTGSQTFTVTLGQFDYGTFGAYTGDIVFVTGNVTQSIPVTLNITRSLEPSVQLGKNSASFLAGTLAPDLIGFGEAPDIAPSLTVASSNPWPPTLSGVRLEIRDSQGQTRPAPIYFVTTNALGYLVPSATAAGQASAKLTTAAGATITGTFTVARVSPGLFTANATGSGVPAGFWIRAASNGAQTQDYLFDPSKPLGSRVPVPVNLGAPGDQIFLSLYGTGFRNASQAAANVGGVDVSVAGFAAVGLYQGEDVVNIGPLPRSLAGRGAVTVALSFDGQPANVVLVNIQ